MAYTEGVPSSLVYKSFFATTYEIIFLCLVGHVPPRRKFYICVKFDPVFHPFINYHNRYHTSLPPLISLAGIPGSLRDNHHCDGCSHHHYDDVEGIYCDECQQQVGTGDYEIKRENAQPEPVFTTAGWVSLIFLTVDLR